MAARKRVLVTGSGGFVGRNLIRRLERDYDLFAPRHRELDLLSQEQVDRLFRERDFDCVIHGANIGGNRKDPDTRDVVGGNLRMFLNLARNRDRFGQLIHFGSGAEYDKSRPLVRVGEGEFGRLIPRDDYGFAKYAISRCAEGMENVSCLRLFGVFGPHEDYTYKFISNAIVKNLLGMPIRIMQNVCFDWLYVDDLTDVVAHFLDHPPRHRCYNVTTGRTGDLLTIARTINDLSGRPSEIAVVHEGMNLEYSGDNARLRAELPGYRFTPLREGIEKLRNYYIASMDHLDLDTVRKDPYAERCVVNKA